MKILKASIMGMALTLSFTTLANTSSNYIEMCTGTKYQAVHYGDGNIAGHALVYIHGLCKDQNKEYPQLKVCDSNDDHKGVGVSLDSSFKNVSWIATPTKELALFGDYGTNKVDDQTIRKIIEKSKEYKIYKNVVPDRASYPQAILDYTSDLEEQDILFAIGTDIAFNTARNMYCVKSNVKKTQLTQIKDFLNSENSKYYETTDQYTWSISDNCTHLSVNALAAADVIKKKKIKSQRNFFGKIATLTLPKSELFKAARKLNRSNYSPRKVWRNKKLRNFFLKHNRLPYGAGNLVSYIPIIKNNDFFKTEDASFFSLPVFGMSLKKITSDKKKYASEKVNRELHIKKIKRALKSKLFKKSSDDVTKNEFLKKYKEFLENELNDIEK